MAPNLVLGWELGCGPQACVKQKISPRFSGSMSVTDLRGTIPTYSNAKSRGRNRRRPYLALITVRAQHPHQRAVCLSVLPSFPSSGKAQALSVSFPMISPATRPRPAAQRRSVFICGMSKACTLAALRRCPVLRERRPAASAGPGLAVGGGTLQEPESWGYTKLCHHPCRAAFTSHRSGPHKVLGWG